MRGIALIGLILFSFHPIKAKVWHVVPDKPGRSLKTILRLAQDGDTIFVHGGRFFGPFVVTKSVRLIGEGGPILDGRGKGTVIVLKAPGIVFKGFIVRNSGSRLDAEDAGVLVTAPRVIVEGNRLEDVLFGIYLRHAKGAIVRDNQIHGKDLPLPRRGDLIRVWYSDGGRIEGNEVKGGRDVVLWFSKGLMVRGNKVKGGRYGLHFMFCDDAIIEGNELTGNSVGAYLMYSYRLDLRKNLLAHNRGPSGYGVGLKDVYDTLVEDNLIADNRGGIFLDGAVDNVFRGNFLSYNDVGVIVLPSSYRNAFFTNSFVDNGRPVQVAGQGRIGMNRWEGNFWSDYQGYDVDGDGVGDIPYRLTQLFERLTGRHPALKLFAYSPIAYALDFSARLFPIFAPRPTLRDPRPLMRPLPPVVKGTVRPLRERWWLVSLGALLGSLGVLALPFLLSRRRRDKKHPLKGREAVRVQGLTKRFGKTIAVNDLNLTVHSGETVALWGPNGAGKTTVLRCLLGLLSFEGEVTVMGVKVQREGKKVRDLIGYLPQEVQLPLDWTVRETLSFFAQLRRVALDRGEKLAQEWGLEESLDKSVGSLSGGMRQKLALVLALLSDPPLLLLDEPTSNLDFQARRDLLGAMRRLKAQGKTLIFCSHRADEINRVADRVVILEGGRKIAEGTPQQVAKFMWEEVVLCLRVPREAVLIATDLLRRNSFPVTVDETTIEVTVRSDRKAEPLSLLLQAAIPVMDFEIIEDLDTHQRPSLPGAPDSRGKEPPFHREA